MKTGDLVEFASTFWAKSYDRHKNPGIVLEVYVTSASAKVHWSNGNSTTEHLCMLERIDHVRPSSKNW